MTNAHLAGVLPVLVTPFADDWSVDEDQLAAQIDWLYGNGADGLVVAMVSEITRLSIHERIGLGRLVCQLNGERGPVVLSVGAESTPLVLELAADAQRAGAQAVMVNAPLVARPSADELLRYFRQVVDAVDVPVIVQDASGYAGASLPSHVPVALFDQYGADRILFKPEAVPVGPRLTELHGLTGGRARVFEGSGGAALVESHRRGIVGTMPGPDLVWAISALWCALEAGREDDAYAISGALAPLMAMLPTLDAYVAVEKRLLVAQGVLRDARMRGPVDYVLDPVSERELVRLLARLQESVGRSLD